MRKFIQFYGANPLHLLAMLLCFALVGYAVMVTGPDAFWNTEVWWQSIAVWFVGALIAHDFILFPLYALADRSLSAGIDALRGRRGTRPTSVPAINYIRVPCLGAALTFVMFFPGIVKQGSATYVAATGLTQEPFLARWLLLSAAMFTASALAYSARLAIESLRSTKAGAP